MNTLARLTDDNPTVCTMVATTMDEKKRLYNATANPSKKLGDLINTEIRLAHIYMQKTEMMDEDTGIVETAVKTILITEEGEGIITHSKAIVSDLQAICAIFGTPDEWDEPVTVRVKMVSSGKGNAYKLEMV